MKSASYLPDKGDIVWVILNPRVGHEQSGRRPAIVLSTRYFSERTGLAVICPITSQIKGLPFEVELQGTKTAGAVLPIHLKSIDIAARKTSFIEAAPPAIVATVISRVQTILS